MKKTYNVEYIVWQTVSHIVLLLFALAALLPFVLLIIASFTDNNTALAEGYSFFPSKWSLDAYRYIANEWNTIGRAYLMTFVVTILGTAGSLVVTSSFAYAQSNKNLPGHSLMVFLCIFTMLFNGGLVSTYYVYSNVFHVRDTIWGLILPGMLMNAFNVILVRNYFTNSISPSILEAARIDGAGEYRIFGQIVLPLSIPIIATIGLMSGIAYWNDWQNGMYYLTERNGSHLYTIQLVLNSINENINFLANNADAASSINQAQIPSTTMRMAIAVIGILPIMAAYPFFQKYFVKGITMGGVKE